MLASMWIRMARTLVSSGSTRTIRCSMETVREELSAMKAHKLMAAEARRSAKITPLDNLLVAAQL